MVIKIVKDTFFSTKKWFITMDGDAIHCTGFTTKKAAEAVADHAAPHWRTIPKWNTDATGKAI